MTRKPVSLNKPSNHGGKRDNSGRKQKYGEPCKRVLIPLSLIPEIMAILEAHKPQ